MKLSPIGVGGDKRWRICLMNTDGSAFHVITPGEANDQVPIWSRDGERLLFYSDRDGNSEIHVMDVAGKHTRRLTNTRAIERAPVWSPDGKRIAFASDGDGSSHVYVMNADGSNVARLTGAL